MFNYFETNQLPEIASDAGSLLLLAVNLYGVKIACNPESATKAMRAIGMTFHILSGIIAIKTLAS